MPNELLRSLPSIDKLLAGEVAERLSAELSRDRVRDLLRTIADEIREEMSSAGSQMAGGERTQTTDSSGNGDQSSVLGPEHWILEIERRLEARAASLATPSLRRVINATGVIIHTNLGRAPLAQAAISALVDVASHYSNLEYDLGRGARGHRESHCQELLARLTGSQAAVVANNNAAAVMLVLNTLAEGGEVIVSRGELVEIGGSFRIPDVMEKSRARLREVGTTNRTRITDYERAINEQTKLILRVHPSNFRIIGFTERPAVHQIAELAQRAGIPSFEDLGSGSLIDLSTYGVAGEPVVKESLDAGISVVSFSGDKLLGGPQAGIIAGSREIIDRVQKNPLMRALRVDKITLAALDATLRLYEKGIAESEVPVIRAVAASRDEIEERAARFCRSVIANTNRRVKAWCEDGESVIGGGSAPAVKLPTILVSLEDAQLSASSLEERLRRHTVPVIARTERDHVLIDLRTVASSEEAFILEALAAIGESVPATAVSAEM
ncbi:MAG TPA: L-seryl-tRNA(Sec) selenium transferase [Blastocatellia bacterium]|nr:L-seryl-tRNA(Sec) selenium transferase [Blastocatellia bacterium]